MPTVLLLGGSQHLRAFPAEPDFATPISHCSGNNPPERYHRAVFYPSVAGDNVEKVWYVFVTDDYQSRPGQLTDAMLIDELDKAGIAPHMVSIDVQDLQRERRVNAG